ncbi:MAG: META domain-containing protein [Roseinatronobacter sp.]
MNAPALVFFSALMAAIPGMVGPAQGSDRLPEGRWTVTGILGLPVSPALGITLTIEIAGQKISGRAACNRYIGTIDHIEDRVKLRDIGTTRLSCPANLRNIELRFLDALEGSSTYEIGPSGVLVLRSGALGLITAVPF